MPCPNLPDPHPGGKAVFVTWRLADPEAKLLRDPHIAGCVSSVIRAADVERNHCELYAFVVMPDHAHILFSPGSPVSKVRQWIKGVSARRANRLLGRTGTAFWQDESLDHWITSHAEFEETRAYIEANPVRDGLVRAAEQWPYSSAYFRSQAQRSQANGSQAKAFAASASAAFR